MPDANGQMALRFYIEEKYLGQKKFISAG